MSLVTAGTPTLTINSFTTPNTQASVISPATGVILHDYQSPGAGVSPIGNCQSLLNIPSLPTGATACTVSTVLVQGAQTANTFVQSTTKKRESIVTGQSQTIKVENKTSRQSCVCKSSNATGKQMSKVFLSTSCLMLYLTLRLSASRNDTECFWLCAWSCLES